MTTYRYIYSVAGRNTPEYTNRCIAFAEAVRSRGFCLDGDVNVLCNLLIDAMDDIQQFVSNLEEMKEIIDGEPVIGTIQASRDLGA